MPTPEKTTFEADAATIYNQQQILSGSQSLPKEKEQKQEKKKKRKSGVDDGVDILDQQPDTAPEKEQSLAQEQEQNHVSKPSKSRKSGKAHKGSNKSHSAPKSGSTVFQELLNKPAKPA